MRGSLMRIVLPGLIGLGLLLPCPALTAREAPAEPWRQTLLAQARAGAVEAASSPSARMQASAEATQPWSAALILFDAGIPVAVATARGADRAEAARRAGTRLHSPWGPRPAAAQLARGRLLLSLQQDAEVLRMVEYEGRALEVVGDVTALRSLDAHQLDLAIQAQKEYLLRQIDPVRAGFFKLYNARDDQWEPRLRTTYTASGLWTLLRMHDHRADPRIETLIPRMADFLLSMQVQEGPWKGAFDYSIDPADGSPQRRYVVGTVAKTVFTLLDLHRRHADRRYLDAATLAGEWLLTRIREDGRVAATTVWSERKQRWLTFKRESVLYSCETLSALSRLFAVSARPQFAEGAARIAARMLAKAERERYFVGDDYRRANNISTSWLTMAFLDYARISSDPRYLDAAFKAAERLSRQQLRDPANVLDHGRYDGTKASSGNGWINEVNVEVLRRCRALTRPDCARYEADLIATSRWLLQNTYRAENSFHIANPARAEGGTIRNSKSEAVRTDAVCHGGNSLIGVLELLGERARLSLPEAR